MKRKITRTTALLTIFVSALISLSGCGACNVVEELLKNEIPDISLIEEYAPTKKTNIAVFAKNAPSYIVTQNGVMDIYDEICRKTGEQPSGLGTSLQKDGIYCFFTSSEHPFNVGLLSYDGSSFNFLLKDDKIHGSYSYHGATDTHGAISYIEGDVLKVGLIPLNDVKNYSIFSGEVPGESLKAIYQGGNNEFIIKTRKEEVVPEGENRLPIISNNMYIFSTQKGIIKRISFEENGRIFVGAGNNMAIVCVERENSWHIVRHGEDYSKVDFPKEIHNIIKDEKLLKITGDYFVIGNPCTPSCQVFSFEQGALLEEGELKERVKAVSAGKTGKMFNVSYNRFDRKFVFELGKENKKCEIGIFDENPQPVPEILKTISVAKEGHREGGIVLVQASECQEENIFSCVYYDKLGNKIYCIFSFDFETQKIDYLISCGEGQSLINLPGANGIDMILYN